MELFLSAMVSVQLVWGFVFMIAFFVEKLDEVALKK